MSLVRIGRLGRPHGLRGEIALDGASLTVEELGTIKNFVWRGRGAEDRTLMLVEARTALPRPLLRFSGCASRDAASDLTNGELWAERDRLPDPGPGIAYTFELIGCRVVADDGRELGTLEDIWSTGAHPIYVVQGEKELLLPAHPGVVKNVDLAARIITVTPPRGIEEL
jgi:16S rRNA processing protein RimM